MAHAPAVPEPATPMSRREYNAAEEYRDEGRRLLQAGGDLSRALMKLMLARMNVMEVVQSMRLVKEEREAGGASSRPPVAATQQQAATATAPAATAAVVVDETATVHGSETTTGPEAERAPSSLEDVDDDPPPAAPAAATGSSATAAAAAAATSQKAKPTLPPRGAALDDPNMETTVTMEIMRHLEEDASSQHATPKAAAAERLRCMDIYLTASSNASLILLKQGKWSACVQQCDAVLEFEPLNVKATYRKACALAGRGDAEEAVKVIDAILRVADRPIDLSSPATAAAAALVLTATDRAALVEKRSEAATLVEQQRAKARSRMAKMFA